MKLMSRGSPGMPKLARKGARAEGDGGYNTHYMLQGLRTPHKVFPSLKDIVFALTHPPHCLNHMAESRFLMLSGGFSG